MQSQLTKIRCSKWFWTVWLFWFLVWFGWFGFSQPYSYLGWIYKLDITQETEIRHTDSTHKNRIIQGVLNSLVDIWFGWFGFSQPYDCLWWKYNLDITQKAIIWHAGLTHENMLTQGVLDGCDSLVWLVWFFSIIQLSWVDNSTDITQDTEIWYAGSTHKNKTIQWGLYTLVVTISVFIFIFTWSDYANFRFCSLLLSLKCGG